MDARDIATGDILQIDPAHDPRYGGCLMVVEEVKTWGYQGYVLTPAGGRVYYRVPNGGYAKVGRARWLPEDVSEKITT